MQSNRGIDCNLLVELDGAEVEEFEVLDNLRIKTKLLLTDVFEAFWRNYQNRVSFRKVSKRGLRATVCKVSYRISNFGRRKLQSLVLMWWGCIARNN